MVNLVSSALGNLATSGSVDVPAVAAGTSVSLPGKGLPSVETVRAMMNGEVPFRGEPRGMTRDERALLWRYAMSDIPEMKIFRGEGGPLGHLLMAIFASGCSVFAWLGAFGVWSPTSLSGFLFCMTAGTIAGGVSVLYVHIAMSVRTSRLNRMLTGPLPSLHLTERVRNLVRSGRRVHVALRDVADLLEGMSPSQVLLRVTPADVLALMRLDDQLEGFTREDVVEFTPDGETQEMLARVFEAFTSPSVGNLHLTRG